MINDKLKNDYRSISTSYGDFGDTLPALQRANEVINKYTKDQELLDIEEFTN